MRLLSTCCALLLIPLLSGCLPSFLITPVQNVNEIEEVTVKPGQGWSPKKIAIIEVEGMLFNAQTGGFLAAQENKLSLFTQQLEQASRDPKVVAVVLRINSPGGTVTATDTMYETLKKFRAKTHKPVVASAQDLCASGAYYVACAADKIVTHPTSVIGSIGVIFQDFDVADGMAKLGIRSNAIKSAPLKDMGSPFHHLSEEERKIMQDIVDEYYARFKGVVTANRPITDPTVLQLVTDGRVFTGSHAVQLGLADQTGLLDDAIKLAEQLSKSPDSEIIQYKRPYGYKGSIYASSPDNAPQSQSPTININLPYSRAFLPTGFYYLWQP